MLSVYIVDYTRSVRGTLRYCFATVCSRGRPQLGCDSGIRAIVLITKLINLRNRVAPNKVCRAPRRVRI